MTLLKELSSEGLDCTSTKTNVCLSTIAPTIQNQYICLSIWFENSISFDVHSIIDVSELYKNYESFCMQHGISPFNIERWSSFILVLSALKFKLVVQRTRRKKKLHFTYLKLNQENVGGNF